MPRLAPTALAPLLAAALAVPAAAQFVEARRYEPVGTASPFLPDSRLGGPGLGRELSALRRDIRTARANGWLTRTEAGRLTRETRRIGHAAARQGRNGLTEAERDGLRGRTEALRSQVNRPPRSG